VSDEKAQLSTDQPTDMEVSEPSLDEHPVRDENSALGRKLMNPKML
jgi:tRNA (adenine-N(1)-)-methyltransferase non-catalytic subunit